MGTYSNYQLAIFQLKSLDKRIPVDQQIKSEDISYILYMTGFGVAQHISNMHLLLFGVKHVDPVYVPEMKRMVTQYNEEIDEFIANRISKGKRK